MLAQALDPRGLGAADLVEQRGRIVGEHDDEVRLAAFRTLGGPGGRCDLADPRIEPRGEIRRDPGDGRAHAVDIARDLPVDRVDDRVDMATGHRLGNLDLAGDDDFRLLRQGRGRNERHECESKLANHVYLLDPPPFYAGA